MNGLLIASLLASGILGGQASGQSKWDARRLIPDKEAFQSGAIVVRGKIERIDPITIRYQSLNAEKIWALATLRIESVVLAGSESPVPSESVDALFHNSLHFFTPTGIAGMTYYSGARWCFAGDTVIAQLYPYIVKGEVNAPRGRMTKPYLAKEFWVIDLDTQMARMSDEALEKTGAPAAAKTPNELYSHYTRTWDKRWELPVVELESRMKSQFDKMIEEGKSDQ